MDSTPCLAILQLCLFRFTALSPSPQSCSTHFWGNSSSFCFPIPQANILLNVLMSPFRWHYPDNSIQITAAHQEGISVDSFKWKAKALYALYLLPCVYLPERRTIGRIPSSWKKNPVLIIRLLIFKKHYLSITNISVVVCLSALVFQLVARRMNNKPNFWQRNPNLPSQMKGNIHFFPPSECWIPDPFSRTGRQNKEVSRLGSLPARGTWGHWCMRSSLSVPIWGEMFLLFSARM